MGELDYYSNSRRKREAVQGALGFLAERALAAPYTEQIRINLSFLRPISSPPQMIIITFLPLHLLEVVSPRAAARSLSFLKLFPVLGKTFLLCTRFCSAAIPACFLGAQVAFSTAHCWNCCHCGTRQNGTGDRLRIDVLIDVKVVGRLGT